MPHGPRPAAACWPLFDLELRTPRLTLRYVDDDTGARLAQLVVRAGVHPPEVMPYTTPWTRRPSPDLEREELRGLWEDRAATGPASWTLPFAVYEGDELVGSQSLRATDFAVTRTVRTASWVSLPRQGRGVGREMRAAVLHLAFAGLGATVASSGSFADNPRSIAVTRSLGYVQVGSEQVDREGTPVDDLRFELDRTTWEQQHRVDVDVDGLAPCLTLLGLGADAPVTG